MNELNELTYKGRDYIYGFEKIRDYPERGKLTLTFFIKQKYGVKPFERTKTILRTKDVFYRNHNKLVEFVEKEIDKYIIVSRRRKLKAINHKKN